MKVKERCLQPRNIREEDCNRKSDDGGNKDVDILRWRVLERAQPAASGCEEVTKKRRYKKDEYKYS